MSHNGGIFPYIYLDFAYTQGIALIRCLMAAPLVYWPQQTDEQLVLGIKCGDTYAASYIEIGSFLPDDGALDTFDWEWETERKYELQATIWKACGWGTLTIRIRMDRTIRGGRFKPTNCGCRE